jgi:hypothetical protein
MSYIDKETPCTKIAKYFRKFIQNELTDFKNAYKTIMTEINNTFEDDENEMT